MFESSRVDWLDEEKIHEKLIAVNLNQYVIKVLKEVDSTNTYIMNNVSILENNTVVAAEFQTRGRGRFDKKWESKMAVGLTVSILLFFAPDYNFELLPLISAVAVNRLLKQFRVKSLIKWPNDICAPNGSKIAGILLESGMLKNKRFVVIGFGINDNYAVNRNLFLSSLLIHLHHALHEYNIFGFALLYREWLDNCIHYNKSVGVYQAGELIDSGINVGLSENGAILIKAQNNKISEYVNASIRFEIS